MSVKELEQAIEQLSSSELAELMKWLEDHQAQAWDTQIQNDLNNHRLDNYLGTVETEIDEGLSRPL